MVPKVLPAVSFLALSIAAITGCKPATSEEKLQEFCVEALKDKMDTWQQASYGWNPDGAVGRLASLEPDVEANRKHDTEQFRKFNVNLSGFKIKNSSGGERLAYGSCKGSVSVDSRGEYDPPSTIILAEIEVDGVKLGI